MKTCSVCRLEKPLDEFHRDTKAKDGRQRRCKPCANAAARQWNNDHPYQVRDNLRRHQRSEQYKTHRKTYRAANAEKINAQKRESYQRNREAIRAQQNAWKRTDEGRAYAREMRKRRRERDPRFVHREAIRALYDLTLEQYDAMVLAQEGRCAICGDPMQEPQVDHCHSRGHVRALLCHLCNRGLGLFRDNPDNLVAAIDYLRAHAPERRAGP